MPEAVDTAGKMWTCMRIPWEFIGKKNRCGRLILEVQSPAQIYKRIMFNMAFQKAGDYPSSSYDVLFNLELRWEAIGKGIDKAAVWKWNQVTSPYQPFLRSIIRINKTFTL